MAHKDPAANRAYHAARARQRWARWRQHGLCVACGLPTLMNPFTKRPYTRCLEHRTQASQIQQAYIARKVKEQAA